MASRAVAPLRNSLVQVKIGNRVYDAIREPRCHTCNHPARMEIETMIVENYAFRVIAERFSEVEHTDSSGDVEVFPELSMQSVQNHYKQGHIPLEAAVLRRLAEKRAEELGVHLDQLSGRFVDHHVYSQAVLERAHQRVVNGEVDVEVKDGLAAAKFLAESERVAGGDLNAEAWSQAMEIYFLTAREIMSPTQWHQFTQALRTNDVLNGLINRINSDERAIEASTVDPYSE